MLLVRRDGEDEGVQVEGDQVKIPKGWKKIDAWTYEREDKAQAWKCRQSWLARYWVKSIPVHSNSFFKTAIDAMRAVDKKWPMKPRRNP